MSSKLTSKRKEKLDTYTEEEFYFYWNIFTQDELNYLENKFNKQGEQA
tara:strand:- start:470 stop:613 length:144 start_codon:yes stop_codon:yes gene_type:complete